MGIAVFSTAIFLVVLGLIVVGKIVSKNMEYVCIVNNMVQLGDD